MNYKATIVIELNYDQRDLAYSLGEEIKTKAAFISKVKEMAVEDLMCYIRDVDVDVFGTMSVELADENSLCCNAPLFDELQDDIDVFSGIIKCEVCGGEQE